MRTWQWVVLTTLMLACIAVGATVLVVENKADHEEFPTAVRSRFIATCVATGEVTEHECECAIEFIEDDMTLEEYTAAEVWMAGGGAPAPVFLEAIAACT